MKPVIYWVRRDFRAADNKALRAACDSGRPVVPVFICDESVEGLGAAPKFRLEAAVAAFDKTCASLGAHLILRRGPALEVLRGLIAETGAEAVYWNRLYDPDAKARDTGVKATLKAEGLEARSFSGHLLFEPWTVETKTGGFYKVFTPMWKLVRTWEVAEPLAAPAKIPAPEAVPASDDLASWSLGAGMRRGVDVLARHMRVGEAAAADRLAQFMDKAVQGYDAARDIPGVDGTSRLSEPLTYGEISPATCWHAGQRAMVEGKAGAETFLKELVWREFAYHLAHHTPQITHSNWKPDWDAFPWNTEDTAEVLAWKQGRTGIPFVDAAMREMYVTGTMHNRGRMIVASYLTKHLLSHWKIGLKWFEDCLIDWDPASNAMGWQWSAGSGPDATPYFRVFNPETQVDKFDRDGAYRRAWLAEPYGKTASATALSYFDAIPESWNMAPDARYPRAIVDPATGRQRALNAYQNRGF